MINITKPFLPPLDEFIPYLERIWSSRILTNSGPLVNELEIALSEKFDIANISLVNNATSGLLLSLKAFNLSGKIITTPFTFAATAQSILWNDCQPIFVDIDPVTFNIDPLQVEMVMDESICAILAVHCYGYPCELQKLNQLSRTHGKILIYDAAHAFGVEVNGKSILSYGDASIVSFHATKVFNTFEGGMIVSKDNNIKSKINSIKNFGIENENSITGIGINAKMAEKNAAMGLLQLNYLDFVTNKRSKIFDLYMNMLSDVDGIILPYHLQRQEKSNFS